MTDSTGMRERLQADPFCRLVLISVLTLAACSAVPQPGDAPAVPNVTPVPDSVRDTLQLAPFYQKYLSVEGLPVLGSTNVSDAAMREAAWILQHMMSYRPEILSAMATHGGRLVVMAYNEYTTDLPEQADMTPKIFWDRRARGLGGRLTSCAEENLLGYPNDPYATENILIHEFSHAIMGVGMRSLDPTFNRRVRETYRKAMDAGLWKGTYAGSNPNEYWAEGAQDWFDNNRENDSVHNHVNTRAELKEYDPALATLCAEVFGDQTWRYHKPMDRPASERTHLEGFDPATAPRFRWRQAPIVDKPRVRIQTELGDIEAELDFVQAPAAVSNFLGYVLDGYYRSGDFFRTVRQDHQTNNAAGAEWILARANPAETGESSPPIPMEDIRGIGVRAVDGTLSLVRTASGNAQYSFSICIGDRREVQSEGDAPEDGHTFAAIGRVTKGMDVARRILEMPAEEERLLKPVRIQNAYRIE